ncbi:hypothetical protein HNQ77_000384 [Silvibacterium bohemicum]|uniref:Uncharacterized protein n=1 Tax=Silvibacterium bohemicum TaxID=1577686 RepID=A0A841JM70_9BACT|nr:hypothetical protein [Silvibacterium bohemicum]
MGTRRFSLRNLARYLGDVVHKTSPQFFFPLVVRVTVLYKAPDANPSRLLVAGGNR